MMRIVIDLQGAQTESRFRGIGRYTMSLAQAIVRNKGEHEIILALNGLFPDTIEPIRAAFDGLLAQENIRVWYVPGPVKECEPANDWRREVAELIREAFLASLQPDVIHISSLFEGYLDDAVTSIGRFDGITPVSVSFYDLIPLLNPDHYLKPNSSYEKHYRLKIEHLKKSWSCLAISEFTRKEGIAYLGVNEDRIFNVSTAVETNFRPCKIDDDIAAQLMVKFGLIRSFIMYTGGVDERKNLPHLIQAFATLPPAVRADHQLLLTGRMPENKIAELKHHAKTLKLKSNDLCFTGYVTNNELIQLYNLCKLFVFPSWHEGFGLPALEAMACGAPVISANTSSLPEVIGLDEALFNPLDVSSISAKMAQALGDENFREMLCKHGLERSKYFSWDKSAQKAISVWESLLESTPRYKPFSMTNRQKPRLAYVSPLPPERTGIADYSAELLPALAEHYDIEVVVAQDRIDEPWVNRYAKVRDVSWLRAHVSDIDRVLYQFGNSPFHYHMLPLLREIPGIVVLHDFFLSSLMAWLENNAGSENAWTDALYSAHGYGAVRERYRNAEAAKREYPVNFSAFQNAKGVIVHSEYAKKLVRQWYGEEFAAALEVIPLLRSPAGTFDKMSARKKLNIKNDDFVVCSFGFLDPTKLNHRLLNSWLNSELASDERCKLIFVGENHGGDYGSSLLQSIKSRGLGSRIRITGYASPDEFRQYLRATDVAVQLRTRSRGETSAAVLDCMNHAVPLIANANGSVAELDPETIWMLPDEFDDGELIEALETLWRDPERRRSLGKRACETILNRHAPAECSRRYTEAIERFYQRAETSTESLVRAITTERRLTSDDTELLRLSKAIAASLPLSRPAKCIFVDITATYYNKLKTGIERVAQGLISALIDAPPEGYRIEPVYLSDTGGVWNYRYARRYTLEFLGCPHDILTDEIVDPECGDVLLGLDLSGNMLAQANLAGLFADYRNQGVSVYFMVHDLLPIRMPDVFPSGANEDHKNWLRIISNFDGAICISKTTADDLIEWQKQVGIDRTNQRSFRIAWSHLGSDFTSFEPSRGQPDNAEWILRQLRQRQSFLMVGTIEPRKGYRQTIEAFSKLWKEGININLVVVGSEGWAHLPDTMRRDIPETINRMRTHPELNSHLFWLEGISDEYLEKLYADSTCLIAASYGEGFGLPLIEAAQHKLPIIARDIPVFREVAGEHAYYFTANNADELAFAIRDWLEQWQKNNAITSEGISYKSWQQSANILVDIILRDHWPYHKVSPDVLKFAIDEHLNIIHCARMHMVRNLLPQGDVILDLGGANCPLYKMGYPHRFNKLYLIDLSSESRHDMYKEVSIDTNCESGKVIVRYGDMTELEEFPDESVDFVWAGQSIEHIPYEKGIKMCQAVYRVLRRGGAFCLDTPNRLITEIHTRDIGGGFINPDHCIEYRPDQLRELLVNSGFEIRYACGVCEMLNTRANNDFCYEDFIYGNKITEDIAEGYIQFFHCVRPLKL